MELVDVLPEDDPAYHLGAAIEAAMWEGRRYGHDDGGLDGFEDEWYDFVVKTAKDLAELYCVD